MCAVRSVDSEYPEYFLCMCNILWADPKCDLSHSLAADHRHCFHHISFCKLWSSYHHNLIKITIDIAPRTSKHTKQITWTHIESHIGHILAIAIPPLVEVHMASRHKARFTWHQGRSHSTRHTSAVWAPRPRSARLIWTIAIGGWMTAAQPPALLNLFCTTPIFVFWNISLNI